MTQPDAPLPPAGAAPFAAPWQAQAFAMTVALNEAGLLPWPVWTAAFSERLAGAAEDGSDYWEQWLATLEALLETRGIAGAGELAGLACAWERAALATPHGTPVRLENDPQRCA